MCLTRTVKWTYLKGLCLAMLEQAGFSVVVVIRKRLPLRTLERRNHCLHSRTIIKQSKGNRSARKGRAMEERLWITPAAQQQVTTAGLSLPKFLGSLWYNVWAACYGLSRRFYPMLFTTEIPLANGETLVLKSWVPAGADSVNTLTMPGEDAGLAPGEPCGDSICVLLEGTFRDADLETVGTPYRDSGGTMHWLLKPVANSNWKT
jgi:hypothetical protein